MTNSIHGIGETQGRTYFKTENYFITFAFSIKTIAAKTLHSISRIDNKYTHIYRITVILTDLLFYKCKKCIIKLMLLNMMLY